MGLSEAWYRVQCWEWEVADLSEETMVLQEYSAMNYEGKISNQGAVLSQLTLFQWVNIKIGWVYNSSQANFGIVPWFAENYWVDSTPG